MQQDGVQPPKCFEPEFAHGHARILATGAGAKLRTLPRRMSAWTPFDWYRDVLYYDIVFDQTTAQEVRFLEQVAERHGTGGRALLEPGCGSGRLVAAMARGGWRVRGFDIQPQALRFARARLRRSRLRAHLSIGRFDRFRAAPRSIDMAHCLYSTIQHATTPGEPERHLALVCDALRTGGLYVIGLHVADYRRREPLRERAACRRGSVRLIYTLRHGPPDGASRLQEMRCRLAVRRARSHEVRRLETHWHFRTYDRGQLRALIASEPRFRLVATHDFHHDADQLNEGRDATFDRVLVLRRER